MSDVPGVTGSSGPSLDDIADVLARTNRGLLALQREVQIVRELLVFSIVFIGAMLLSMRARVRGA